MRAFILCLTLLCSGAFGYDVRYYRKGPSLNSAPRFNSANTNNCVSVRPSYSYGSYSTSVATCGFVEGVENALSDLADRVDSLEDALANETEALQNDVTALDAGVRSLQGEGKELFKVFAGTQELGFRRFCEFYSYAEVSDACIFFGYPIPDVFFIHFECGDGPEFVEPCPETFWKIEVGCYKPNSPRYRECAYDPLPRNETCTRLLYISCDGYTTNIAEDWMKLDFEQADAGNVIHHEP